MKYYCNINNNVFFEKKGSKIVLLPPAETAHRLVESAMSNLEYLRVYPTVGSYFIYNNSKGIYLKVNSDELMYHTREILELTGIRELRNYDYVRRVVANLLIGPKCYEGVPIFDSDYLVFTNGVLNLDSLTFAELSSNYFCISKISFAYDPTATCPTFLKFLNEFCGGHKDRMFFIQAWLNCIIYSRKDYQVFLFLLGPGATGKSTLTLIATALIGMEATITTSLKSLHKDTFEAYNLIGKRLILLSDSEQYGGELNILKQMVGGDAIQGRAKHIQAAYNVTVEGLVVIVSNHPLTSRDSSGAVIRRMRTFLADFSVESRRPLLTLNKGKWTGLLSNELPGIFNWCLNLQEPDVYNYVVDMKKYVPSLQHVQTELEEIINPLLQWAREELESGEGSYVGYKVDKSSKGLIEDYRRRALYPAYFSWCQRQGISPISHKRFSNELLITLSSLNFKVYKLKRTLGIYITGIVVKSAVFHRDYLYGAPVVPLEAPTSSTTTLSVGATTKVESSSSSDLITAPSSTPLRSLECHYIPFKKGEVHASLTPTLYKDYMTLLSRPAEWDTLNKVFTDSSLDFSKEYAYKLAEDYTKETTINSEQYFQGVLEKIQQNLSLIQRKGVIPVKYKPLGVSPRILPVGYSETINSVKRIVRNFAYKFLAESLRYEHNLDYVIVDLDLKSCYTSIVLGLYPDHLSRVQQAIESIGLWEYIRQEFERKGRMSIYSKPAVKICTYSSFFQGGPNAMITGIMDNFRKDLGLRPAEFRTFVDYETMHTLAREVAAAMNESEIIHDFRSVSARVLEEYKGEFLCGPTGHNYPVDNVSFKTSYPNYLQSFEFALLAQSTLNIVNRYENLHVIGHYHDGNVLMIPTEDKEMVLEDLKTEVTKIGERLGLCYPQSLEIKAIY